MKKLRDSLKYAVNGLKETLIFERNFKIMLFFALLAVFLMFYFPTSRTEKAVITTAIFAVLTLELINIAIERLLDFLQPEYSDKVRIIKDLMAAIVLLASLGAMVIGLIVFWPHIF
ncbi:MAG: diacylglycerol kinase family protein [Patescibacteria group bacterium]|nr:diacylglycerol kinase family protein [Patescibacteria group bacterium]